MAKRPSLLDNIDMTTEGQGAKTSAQVVDIKAMPQGNNTNKTVKSTVYLPTQVNRLLKEIALARNCKVHDLFIEGLDHVLTSKGYATVKELGKK